MPSTFKPNASSRASDANNNGQVAIAISGEKPNEKPDKKTKSLLKSIFCCCCSSDDETVSKVSLIF